MQARVLHRKQRFTCWYCLILVVQGFKSSWGWSVARWSQTTRTKPCFAPKGTAASGFLGHSEGSIQCRLLFLSLPRVGCCAEGCFSWPCLKLEAPGHDEQPRSAASWPIAARLRLGYCCGWQRISELWSVPLRSGELPADNHGLTSSQ